jgi:16S rRNA U1498 N3-methylase RsmE
LEDEAARQMSLVLKLRAGEQVVLCDGQGMQATFTIAEISKGRVGLARMHEPDVVPTETAPCGDALCRYFETREF